MAQANISSLKAHLSEYLRKVQRGQTITIVDRTVAIAELRGVPEPSSQLRPVQDASGQRPGDLRFKKLPRLGTDDLDVVALLREDRSRR
jgi:antitoxin (DNA-binding transcriptional repressor) of toxin-antitoxin stability system